MGSYVDNLAELDIERIISETFQLSALSTTAAEQGAFTSLGLISAVFPSDQSIRVAFKEPVQPVQPIQLLSCFSPLPSEHPRAPGAVYPNSPLFSI